MSDPRPVQAGGWRELILGEEATAASEMVILLPVYLLMLTGLFMTGNMMQARQALVQAVRFEAWTQKQVNGANFDAFFHGIPGRYERVRDPGLQRGRG